MALDKKAEALLSLHPDIAVVPECSEKSALAFRERGFNSLWFGCNPHKGLGVFCRNDWEIRTLASPEQKWIVPIEVAAPAPFTLIAVWTCRVGSRNVDNYIGQMYHALTSHPEWCNGIPVVVAGDLNSNKRWDERHAVVNHTSVVSILAERGLASAYHEFFQEPQGRESRPTFHLNHQKNKPYHIDYIFVPKMWMLKSVAVGTFDAWSKLSDHCPVVVELGD